jgi:YD repeat-containing protein
MRRHARTAIHSIAVTLLAVAPPATSQTVQYAYDAVGRLTVVADPRGDLAVYDYDAVGNLLAIRRVPVADVPDPVVVALVVPEAARAGATVSVFGKGFSATADDNSVTFNGTRATVLTARPTRLTVRVPSDATTGPVRVAAPLGAAVSVEAFRVLGVLSITPSTAVVAPLGSVRFTVSGEGTGAVRWSVDGLAGGDALRGAITSEGVYTAPAALAAGVVRVTATSASDPTLEATARVSVVAARPVFTAARPLAVDNAPRAPQFVLAASLSLRRAPVVTHVAPPEAARGEALRLTVTGAGFEGATRLEFLSANTVDADLAVGALVITPDGSEATADVSITAHALPGPRIVRIVTPSGSSTGAVLGDNLFTVR